MQRFARLHAELDANAGDEGACLAVLRGYFAAAAPADAAWAVHLLGGGRVPHRSTDASLRRVAIAMAAIDEWLFDECERVVGDLAETIALLLPPPLLPGESTGLATWIEERLPRWRELAADEQEAPLREALARLDRESRFVLLRLMRGGRLGVARALLLRALAEVAAVPPTLIAERLEAQRGKKPGAARWQALIARAVRDGIGQPYAFRALQVLGSDGEAIDSLSPAVHAWQVEWLHEGLRLQVVRRGRGVWIWSRDGDLVGRRHPALAAWARALPAGMVIDGVLANPGRFLAFDLLEADGVDLRGQTTAQRRHRLEVLLPCGDGMAALSAVLDAPDAQALASLREQARALGHRGLVLKRRSDAYEETGTPWWAWPTEPLAVAAVLVYAQAGAGSAGEYTFALWNRTPADGDEARAAVEAIERGAAPGLGALRLMPIAKIALPPGATAAIEPLLRENTVTRFGPVRVLRPTLVAEIAYDAVTPSRRHKSGVVLRGARFVCWIEGLAVREAAAVGTVRGLVAAGA